MNPSPITQPPGDLVTRRASAGYNRTQGDSKRRPVVTPFFMINQDALRSSNSIFVLLGLSVIVLLLQDNIAFAEAWNFGPSETEPVTAQQVVEKAIALWGEGEWAHARHPDPPKETTTLRLNWEKAAKRLGWRPIYDWEEAVAETVRWFKCYQQTESPQELYAHCARQIQLYTERAAAAGLPWAAERVG